MRLVIGGTSSGSGKTSLALALAAGFAEKGYIVSGFKCGPDYLDPMYMELVCQSPCYNLDTWMSTEEHVRDLAGQSSGLAVIEGVMGFYDGPDATGSKGSTAHTAMLLDAPVVLVAQASAMARSFAALVHGFVSFELVGQNIKGIIANHCGSDRHARILSRVLEASGLPPLLGAVPADSLPTLPSRHLGLKVPHEKDFNEQYAIPFARAAEKYLKLDSIAEIAARAKPIKTCSGTKTRAGSKTRIAVARDQAFNFYYQANLSALEKAGAELVFFSPVRDRQLPRDISLVYLGGGYPELFAHDLSQNRAMRKSIAAWAGEGGHIYAECGGLVYLCRELKALNGQVFAMAGVLPFRSGMLPRRKSLGYVQIRFMRDCLLGEKGQKVRGHEYHYSDIYPEDDQGWENVYEVRDARGQSRQTLGITRYNVLASYAHVYFGHRPDLAARLTEDNDE